MVALNHIGQIAIAVRDLPRAVTFYRDVLGMRHLFDAGPKLSFFEDEPHVIAKLPSHDLWMTFARDSEDNVFALMSEVTQR